MYTSEQLPVWVASCMRCCNGNQRINHDACSCGLIQTGQSDDFPPPPWVMTWRICIATLGHHEAVMECIYNAYTPGMSCRCISETTYNIAGPWHCCFVCASEVVLVYCACWLLLCCYCAYWWTLCFLACTHNPAQHAWLHLHTDQLDWFWLWKHSCIQQCAASEGTITVCSAVQALAVTNAWPCNHSDCREIVQGSQH